MVHWLMAWFTTLIAAGLGWFWHWHVTWYNQKNGQKSARDLIDQAKREADVLRREAQNAIHEDLLQQRELFEKDALTRRKRLADLEDRYNLRLLVLEEKDQALTGKESRLIAKEEKLDQWEASLVARDEHLNESQIEHGKELERVAKLTVDQAREELVANVREAVENESADLLRHSLEQTRSRAQEEARRILAIAIERYASTTVVDVTAATVDLPDDEMKGRIIGKEGRNIRSLEQETGINIVIDDTPKVVTLSGYDPMRRDVARIALQRLVDDGRIHPASIEETVATVRDEVEAAVKKAGEDAVYALQLRDVAPELVHTLGRLRYRQSFSQNVLEHSIEMAHVMAMMAAELDLDEQLARRIGLFHDIGKALSHEQAGSHALVGAKYLEKNGEDPVVVNAVASHHLEVEQETVYAHLAAAADAVTAARPGARTESTQSYLKRLGDLEDLATALPGVERAFAIQAGRELRVLVNPQEVDDAAALVLARTITNRIKDDVHFPGQVKVTVIRETRCVEYAR